MVAVASDKPETRTQLGVAIREMAAPAGFRINVQTMPHATYLDQVWKKGNFYVGFYNMQPTPDAIFKLLYTSDAAWNETLIDRLAQLLKVNAGLIKQTLRAAPQQNTRSVRPVTEVAAPVEEAPQEELAGAEGPLVAAGPGL